MQQQSNVSFLSFFSLSGSIDITVIQYWIKCNDPTSRNLEQQLIFIDSSKHRLQSLKTPRDKSNSDNRRLEGQRKICYRPSRPLKKNHSTFLKGCCEYPVSNTDTYRYTVSFHATIKCFHSTCNTKRLHFASNLMGERPRHDCTEKNTVGQEKVTLVEMGTTGVFVIKLLSLLGFLKKI